MPRRRAARSSSPREACAATSRSATAAAPIRPCTRHLAVNASRADSTASSGWPRPIPASETKKSPQARIHRSPRLAHSARSRSATAAHRSKAAWLASRYACTAGVSSWNKSAPPSPAGACRTLPYSPADRAHSPRTARLAPVNGSAGTGSRRSSASHT
ncbi:hypothetical protein [Streptomyces sp. NPDC001537]